MDKWRDRETMPFKWTPKNEEQLEALLIQHNFDFVKCAKEFSKMVNEEQSEHFF